MDHPPSTSPQNRRQLVDEYFIENRTKLLDIAAFLDRLARAGHGSPEQDFRMAAFQRALDVLSGSSSARVSQIQMIFSDPTTEPIEKVYQKGARGAYEEPGQRAL